MKITGNDILESTKGQLVNGDPGITVAGFSIDTRQLKPGQFFIPLAGEREDGHRYVLDALRKGASGSFYSLLPLPAFPAGSLIVQVGDTLTALQQLASAYRRRFTLPVIAVTGSSGKTTTKDLISSVLSGSQKVLKTAGNLNNEIGLPLTLLSLTGRHQAAVVEMGMSAPGEITALARVARPQVGVITNVGPAHLEQLGSLEGVARAKQELLNFMGGQGVAVLNGDDPLVREMGQNFPGKVYYYGFKTGDYRAAGWSASGEGSKFQVCFPDGQDYPFELSVPGKHMVENALAAIAVGSLFNLSPFQIARGLASCRFAGGRLQIRRAGKVTLIDDSYNANPASMKASLQVLRQLGGSKTVAVLGDMLELGPTAPQAHREIGRYAAISGVAYVVTVGQLAGQIAAGAREGGVEAYACRDHSQALQVIYGLPLQEGWHILVKGSRGMKMEHIASGLLKAQDRGLN
ncbi:MAG TPA: UDP-N-acetylmuramoyl-tripeptide--D-alanyl-D-alanine ligase [Firmicutes bacterium]|nr:UDP-N-acetylmuramoyl-tripeptide--D-alanyl-D-alanine ligase [Bacillota bacterium]